MFKFNLRQLIPTYTPSGQALHQAALVILALIFLISLLYLLRGLAWRLKKKEPLDFLELTFPANTNKTAYSTEQLFSLLHSLTKQQNLFNRILGIKNVISFEITATKEDGIRYCLVIPTSQSDIIEKSLLSYLPGLKVKHIVDYLPVGQAKGPSSGIIEMKLDHDFTFPLGEQERLREHDPISYLCGNMTKLGPGETVVVQAVATPLTQGGRPREYRHFKKVRQQIYQNQPLAEELLKADWRQTFSDSPMGIFRLLLKLIGFVLKFFLSLVVSFWDHDGSKVPFLAKEPEPKPKELIGNPYEEALRAEIKAKIDQPLFETSLRLLILTKDQVRYTERAAGLLASFSALGNASQTLSARHQSFLKFGQPSWSQLRERRVSLGTNLILSVSELSAIYHLPFTETTKTEDLVKNKCRPLPAPLSFKKADPKLDNIFAQNSYGGTESAFGQTLEERRRHTYILGGTGTGKTNLLATMIKNDIDSGKGVAVVDPHGDLIEKLLRVIPKERIKDVVWFAPDDDGFPIALNLLALPDQGTLTESQLQKQKSLVASSIISIIQKFYDAKFFGPRMEYVLRNAILTVLETPDPTLQTVLDLLTKKRFRRQVVSGLNNKVLSDYWTYEFEPLGLLQRNAVISPITNKIGGILASPLNYNILTQPKSKLDFDQVLSEGKILLCDLSKGKVGEDESSFFGSLILAKIQLAALRRALIPEDQRRDFFLYVDEFQNFATATFAELVSEARKYRLSTIIAHQSISQVEDRDIVKVILANVGAVICFKNANPEDEQFILPIFSPEVSKHEISNLPPYNFYMKVSAGKSEDAFIAQAFRFDPEQSEGNAGKVIEQSREKYGTPTKEVEKVKLPKSEDHLRSNKAEKVTVSTPKKPPQGQKVRSRKVG